MWKYIKNITVVVSLTSGAIGVFDYIKRTKGNIDTKRVDSERISDLQSENIAQRHRASDILSEAKHNWTQYKANHQEIKDYLKEVEIAKDKGHMETANYHQQKANELVEQQNIISKDMENFDSKYKGPDSNSYISNNDDSYWDSFNNYFDSMKNFSSSLDDNQLLAFIHCSFIFVIFIALYSVFLYKFWDYVIIRYDLEKKYPKFSLIFKVRNKFSKYSQIYYLILIVILLLFLFSLNAAIFLKLL